MKTTSAPIFLFIVFIIMAVADSTSAQDAPPQLHAGFQVHKISTTDSRIGLADANFITLSPANVSSTVRQHRYQVASTGQIGDMSVIDWKQPKDQSYLILPAKTDVRFDTGTPGQLDVTTASGLIFRFRSGLLAGITDESGGQPCDVTFTRNAKLDEHDFTIKHCDDRIVFDTGIGTTNGAYANLSAKTKVYDPAGRMCVVPNSVLYEKLPGRQTTADVKLKSQTQIYQALKRSAACSGLDFSAIAATGTSGATGARPSRLGPDFLRDLGSH